MIYIYFFISFPFTFFSFNGFKGLNNWWQKLIVTLFYIGICMVWLPMSMGKLLHKIYEKNN